MASKTGDILHTQAKAILGLIVSKLSEEHPQAPYSSLHSAAADRPQTMELAPWSIHFPSARTGFSSRKPLPGGLRDRPLLACLTGHLKPLPHHILPKRGKSHTTVLQLIIRCIQSRSQFLTCTVRSAIGGRYVTLLSGTGDHGPQRTEVQARLAQNHVTLQ